MPGYWDAHSDRDWDVKCGNYDWNEIDEVEEEARREAAIEDARRWLDRAAKCERLGYIRDHCLDQFEAALERAGMTVVGEIVHFLEGGW